MRSFLLLSFLLAGLSLIAPPSLAQNYNPVEKRENIQEMRKLRKLQSNPVAQSAVPQEKRVHINNQKDLIQEHRTKQKELKALSPEERKSYMDERREQWNTLSEEQKQAKRETMIERWSKLPPEVRQKRIERFKAMPEERQQAFKERHPQIYQDLISQE